MRLVLASQSPRRADVLRQLGLDPVVLPADVNEALREGESAEAYVERLAKEKAMAIAATETDALVVGGDTVVVNDGEILSKPDDAEGAVSMLMQLSGSDHEVLSGIALAGPRGVVSTVARTTVRMRTYDETTARAYVATGEPFDKAGAYGIQGQGAALVASIGGDYYAVVGFPVGAFLDLLVRGGWRFGFDGVKAADND
jgi:septum formation protein